MAIRHFLFRLRAIKKGLTILRRPPLWAGEKQKDFHSDVIFFTKTEMNGGRPIVGGGICVHPEGYVVTTARNVPRNHGDVTLRCRSNPGTPLRAVVRETWRQFDICLLQIVTPEGEKRGPFRHVKLRKKLFLRFGQPLFSFVNPGGMPDDYREGTISFRFQSSKPPDFPDLTDARTIRGGLRYARKQFRRAQVGESHRLYRTASTIIDVDHFPPDLPQNLLDFHANLPLVEVHGMFVEPGCWGCPVFKSHTKRFIGLVSFAWCSRDLIIPSSFISLLVLSYLSSLPSDPSPSQAGPSSVAQSDPSSTSSVPQADPPSTPLIAHADPSSTPSDPQARPSRLRRRRRCNRGLLRMHCAP